MLKEPCFAASVRMFRAQKIINDLFPYHLRLHRIRQMFGLHSVNITRLA